MPERDVVVIGASAGGVETLRRLVADLPAGLPASVLIAVHTPESPVARLPEILGRTGWLPAAYAVSGQRLTPGLLTVAPPRRHLVVTAGDVLRLHRGPELRRARPAIDPLLLSAARTCGPRVVAVVLSGLLRDGAEGAAAVAAAGGCVLVQDPADARYPDMPEAVVTRVPGAALWPAAKLGAAIADLVGPIGSSGPGTIVPGGLGAIRPGGPGAAVGCDGIDEALWLAVDRLQAHAAVQQRIHERLEGLGPLAGQAQAQSDRALRAADLITAEVLPLFRPQ
ncbi:chemotaxis protein CheB [Dactylosporangium sp. NPDC051541]|uniref:chemotaxis protein CheB n=1 Tax=Dactylosporangium sp. NPDC051541 TaxID=3363977 RepID=UPI0037B9A2E7